jgi:uncharacterized membrane protein YdbT with pleckstrin-like domain
MTERERELQDEINKKDAEIIRLHNELVDIRLEKTEKAIADHETRLRVVEPVIVRSNVLFALTTGGGIISAIMLIKTLASMP